MFAVPARLRRPLKQLAWRCVQGVAACGLLAGLSTASAQTGPANRPSREATWPAPTAEDWKRPCLIQWQRTWEDARAVSAETGKPILVCVNMDGEIASEHYAGVRYRQPEIAALYQPYVCVIASVYRHTPRDHDEQGRRVVCPRFGTVTCGEHIAIEPGLHARYFEDQRIAPRHIGVELQQGSQDAADGAEMFDVFYAWDTETIFDALRQGVAGRETPTPEPRGDLSVQQLVASRDSRNRLDAEGLYQQGDRELRRALLEAALTDGGAAPIDLLRLALFGFDEELSRLARQALARSSSVEAVDLIIEALNLPMEEADRETLVAALERLGTASPRARTVAFAHRALASHSSVDVEGWSKALQDPAATAPLNAVRVARLEHQNEILASDDAIAHVELAEALLALAEAEPDPQSARLLLMDARQAAHEGERLGATGGRVNSVLALAALSAGDADEARERAEAGVSSVAALPGSRSAMRLLVLFAKARQRAIAKAVREKAEWPAQWLADVNAAYTVLAHHPLGDDSQVVMHYDFVKWFGADARAERILDEGLARFSDSWVLNDRYRAHVLRVRGVYGLEAAYEQKLQDPAAPPSLEAFAGYASLVAAEFQRRAGDAELAAAAYDRGIAHYERSLALDPQNRAMADHYIALALAGRARTAYERGDDEGALQQLLACFARKPDAVATPDGLNVSPADTARLLKARLLRDGRDDLLASLDAALAQLDPALLGLPAYERSEPGEAPSAADAPSGGAP